MRKLVLHSTRLRMFLPEADEAIPILSYFMRNEKHLAPADPVLPRDFLTMEYWQRRLRMMCNEFDRDQSVQLFLEPTAKPGAVIGSINFTHICRGPFQSAHLGYSVDQDYEGQGMMTEALEVAIHYMFRERHLHQLVAYYMPENLKSEELLMRMKFEITGRVSDYLFIRGQWRTHMMAIRNNPDWKPRLEDANRYGF